MLQLTGTAALDSKLSGGKMTYAVHSTKCLTSIGDRTPEPQGCQEKPENNLKPLLVSSSDFSWQRAVTWLGTLCLFKGTFLVFRYLHARNGGA